MVNNYIRGAVFTLGIVAATQGMQEFGLKVKEAPIVPGYEYMHKSTNKAIPYLGLFFGGAALMYASLALSSRKRSDLTFLSNSE